MPRLRLPLCAALLPLLAGCSMPAFLSFPPQARGSQVDPAALSQLVPGTSTRADVTALLGTPTAKATFNDNDWLYIGETTKPVIAGTQAVLSQQVVSVTFDQKGVVQAVNRKTQDDALPVSVVSRTTPSPGSEASFLQQLLGNVGRFSAGAPASSGIGSTGGGLQQ